MKSDDIFFFFDKNVELFFFHFIFLMKNWDREARTAGALSSILSRSVSLSWITDVCVCVCLRVCFGVESEKWESETHTHTIEEKDSRAGDWRSQRLRPEGKVRRAGFSWIDMTSLYKCFFNTVCFLAVMRCFECATCLLVSPILSFKAAHFFASHS